jgi:hypothetical protein
VAIVFIADIPTMTGASYRQAINQVRDELKAALGFIAHAGTATENGFRVTEIWESQAQCMRFLQETIMPMAQRLGVPAFQPQFLEADEAFTR